MAAQPPKKRPSLEELYAQSRKADTTRPSLDSLYEQAYGPKKVEPTPEERPGVISRFLNRAAVSGMQAGADIGEMLQKAVAPPDDLAQLQSQFGIAAGRASRPSELRQKAAELEAKVPEAQTLPEYVASAAGYIAPDVAATMLGSGAVSGVSSRLRAESLLRRILTPDKAAGAIRRNIPGAIAAAPLVTIPGALSEESTRSATGTLGEMLTGERPSAPVRVAGDIAIDVLGGAAAEKILLNPLARVLGKGAKAAPAAAAAEEAATPAAPAQRLLTAGAYQMPTSTEQFRQAGIDEIMRRTREQVEQARAMGQQPVPPPVVEPVVSPVTPRDQMLLGAGETPLMLGAGEQQALLPRVQTPLLLERGAIRMGSPGWREREMLESAVKFAEEQRTARQAREVVPDQPVGEPAMPRDQMLLGAGETPLLLRAGETQPLLSRAQEPLLLQRGAIRMGPIGWREREQLEAAIKFAEEQRAQRQAVEGYEPPPIWTPQTVGRRRPWQAPEGATPEEVAQYMNRPLERSPVDIMNTFMAGEERQAARRQKLERAKSRLSRGAADANVLAPIGQAGIGATAGLATDQQDDGMTPMQRAIAYGAVGAGLAAGGTTVAIRALRREVPTKVGDAWTARQLALGQRGVPAVRQFITEYGESGELIPRASAVDEQFKRRVADWFDQVRSAPDDPEVRRAYRAFADETRKQYEYLTDKGVQFEFVDNPAPYKNSSEMMQDIAENNRLLVYKTQADSFHPLLSPEENDMFRAVHDYFGHAGYGHQFGPLGEENAYRVHSAMFSPEARRAMATETRGQNSWVNTRPENKAKPGTVYADQKVALMPEDMMGPYPSEVKMARPTSGVTNVEYKSSYQPGFTPGEFKRLSTIEKRLGRTAFIKRVVQPIVQSEGLPVEVANGIGSWLSEGDPGLTEAARLGFQNIPGKSIARVLGRVSQAAKQLGFFFPVPNPEGDAVALTLDFGRKMSEREYKQAISKITAADGGQRFNGTTMVALSPSRAQIVLNDGLDETAAEELAALAQQALPRYNIQSATQRVTPIFGGGENLEEAFRDYALKVGVLTPEQALAQQQSIRAYENIGSNRIRRAALGAADELRTVLDRLRAPSDASMGGMAADAAGASADRLAGGTAVPESAARGAAAIPPGEAAPVGAAAPEEVAKTLGGTAFDVGGAFGAALGTQFGREALPKIAVGVGGYELEQMSDDPRLKATGEGMQLLSALSLGYRPSKELVRSGAVNLKDALAQSPQGRTALNLISRDILIDPKIKAVVDVAEREMAKYRATGLDLARRARALGPEGDRLVSDLMENERIESRADMSDETIKAAMAVAQKVAQEVTGLGREKVATGIISEETYKRRMSSYLKRLYAAMKGGEAVTPFTVKKGNRIFRFEPERIRNENLSLEERNALGEIREASVRLGETFTEGGKNIATMRLFNALAGIDGVIEPAYKQAMESAENARLFSEAAYASGDAEMGRAARRAEIEAKRKMKAMAQEIVANDDQYVVLPDTPKLSFLRGAAVRRDAAEYLMAMPDFAIETVGARGVFDKLTRFWKRVHTVYNPGTHVGNFLSNASKVHMGGLPLSDQPEYLTAALKDLRSYGPATKALAEAGVLERGIPTYGDMQVTGLASQTNTLRQLAETTRPETRQALTARGVTPQGKVSKALGYASQKAQQAYALEDGIYRVALYQKFLDNGMDAGEAVKEVERVLPGYDTRSPLLTGIKNTVSPFIMYPVKYIPSLMEDIMDHPARWVTLAALWGGLDQASRRQYAPVEDRDLRPEQRPSKSLGYLLPGTIQTDAIMRPLAKALNAEPKEGEKYTFDIARYTPLGLFSGSPAPGSVIGKVLPGVPGASLLQPSGFLPEILSRFGNIDPFTGREWMTGAETPGQKAQMIAEDVVLPFVAPTAVSYYGKKMVKETLPSENRSELLSDIFGLLGARPQLVRPGMQSRYERQDFMNQIRAIESKRDNLLRKTESPERRQELQQEAAQEIQRIRAEFYAKRQELNEGAGR